MINNHLTDNWQKALNLTGNWQMAKILTVTTDICFPLSRPSYLWERYALIRRLHYT